MCIRDRIKPNEGRIFLESDEGQASELTDLPVYRRAQLRVGYLAQEASVFRLSLIHI